MINWSPKREDISLHGGDFIVERTKKTGPLPPGTTAEIEWSNAVTWPAVVDGSTVAWRIESEECTPEIIPDGTAFIIWIHYPNTNTDTTDDYPWIHGRARRTDQGV